MGRLCFLDLETGGLRVEQPIIQIAAIAVDGDWNEVESLEFKIAFDPARCDAEALAINHYTAEAWADAVPEAVAVSNLAAFLNRHRSVELVSKRTGRPYSVARVAGHNASFDLDRLSALFKRYDTFFPVDFGSVLDTRFGAIWHGERTGKRPANHRLVTLAEHHGIPVAGAHDALVDVRLSIALARVLVAA